MRLYILLSFLFSFSFVNFSQDEQLSKTTALDSLKFSEELLLSIETEALKKGRAQLKSAGYPQSTTDLEIVEHSGFVIGFDCNYKMAAWTFHVLSEEVSRGTLTRSSSFREDKTVKCGSAVEQDYSMKQKNENGSVSQKNFGFDRGHLAPSADFNWSKTAMKESFYYSNMTPQRPEFNRGSWVKLETLLRTIVDNEQQSFYVLTGPVLHDQLPVIEKSVHQLRIPEYHYKIIADISTENPRGMAFLMPNQKCEKNLSEYVVSIDSIERLTGLDFFTLIPEQLEKKLENRSDFTAWQTKSKSGKSESGLDLPKGYFTTKQAASKVGSTVSIVGKVVSANIVKGSGFTLLTLDDSSFKIHISKATRKKFTYKPELTLDGKQIVVTGLVEVDSETGKYSIKVTKEEQIRLWEEN